MATDKPVYSLSELKNKIYN